MEWYDSDRVKMVKSEHSIQRRVHVWFFVYLDRIADLTRVVLHNIQDHFSICSSVSFSPLKSNHSLLFYCRAINDHIDTLFQSHSRLSLQLHLPYMIRTLSINKNIEIPQNHA